MVLSETERVSVVRSDIASWSLTLTITLKATNSLPQRLL